ncbi:MAG: hypothetical protein GY804_06815 [Alphaproteobacteria bacterium]|nr:hypothetical protein [Alphaproteobacteria bacterium]
MKALCTGSSAGEVTFKITGKTKPVVGKEYVIESIVGVGSAKQNRTFHPLIECLYKWMLENDTYQFEENGIEYDFRCEDNDRLKIIFKMTYGKGACSWKYVTNKNTMQEIYDLNDAPDYVIEDFNAGNRGRIEARDAISWTEYDKEDRANLITNTINIMRTIGVDSAKFHEIMEGIRQ